MLFRGYIFLNIDEGEKYESLDKKNNTEDEEIEESKFKLVKYIMYFVVFIIISSLTLLYIYHNFEKPSNILIFTKFPVSIIISLVLLLLIYFIFDGLRLYFVIKTLECNIEYKYIFKLVFINLFISNITPFATGGGFIQIYYLTKKNISLGNATAATTIRTILATATVFVATPIILINEKSFETILPQTSLFIYMSLFAVLYMIFFYVVIFKNRLLKKLVYNVLSFIKDKGLISKERYNNVAKYLFKEINIFGESLAYFFSGYPVYMIGSVVFTILFLISELSFSVLLIRGLGYQVSGVSVLLMQVVVLFFMYFAPTPGATGVAEGGFSLVFSHFVKETDMFPLIFAWRLFTKYIGILIGMLIFFISFFREGRLSE